MIKTPKKGGRFFMPKRELTKFGKEAKMQLILINQTQEWLIQQVRKRTDMYVDSSILYKVFTGQVNSTALKKHIRVVLGMS